MSRGSSKAFGLYLALVLAGARPLARAQSAPAAPGNETVFAAAKPLTDAGIDSPATQAKPDVDSEKDSASPAAKPLPDAGKDNNSSPPKTSADQTGERPISWKLLIPNILRDQKPIYLFPTQVVRGQHFWPAFDVAEITAGLVALDPVDAPYFGKTTTFNEFNKIFSGPNTQYAMAAFPISWYAVGLVRHDKYAQDTSLLAGEAVVDSEILCTVMKYIARRELPRNVPPNGSYGDTWFKAKVGPFSGVNSFPSGHTIAAFSIATVFANRYRKHKWVPYVAYGAAGLVGFSRITTQAHFPSDVFAGAAFGYVISKFVVLRKH